MSKDLQSTYTGIPSLCPLLTNLGKELSHGLITTENKNVKATSWHLSSKYPQKCPSHRQGSHYMKFDVKVFMNFNGVIIRNKIGT